MTPFEIRVALKAGGYSPIPCQGKRPFVAEWQTLDDVAEDVISGWPAGNTGVLTSRCVGFDIDITDPAAASAVEDLLKDWADGAPVLVRFGLVPKRAILLQTETPFQKLVAHFVDPAGVKHKIEILGDGQQIIVAGIHPDCKQPYTWHPQTPWQVPRSDLPEITAASARDLLAACSSMLVEEFGFTRVESVNGMNHAEHCVEPGEFQPVDVDAMLDDMALGGGEINGIHHTQLRVTASLLRSGLGLDDTVTQVLEATRRAVNDDPSWNWDIEEKGIRRMAGDFIVKNPELSDLLPDRIRQKFLTAITDGKRPRVIYAPTGWECRAYGDPHEYVNKGNSKSEETDPRFKASSRSSGSTPKVLTLTPYVLIDDALLPPREWLYGRHYQRGTVSLTAGPGGLGKSSLNMVEAVAMAAARKLLGEQPEAKMRIWYHNGEDPRAEIDRRIHAICKYYGLTNHDIAEHLFVTSGNEFPLRVARGYTQIVIEHALVNQMSAVMEQKTIDVAMFDPFVTMHSVSEIDTGKMDAVVRVFAGLAQNHEAAVDVAHHVRKLAVGNDGSYDIDDIRGVKAITDAVRAARILNRMSEKDAENAGCEESERLARFRIDRGKANYSAPQAATWCQFVSVVLGNGDDVGVVAPWEFPGQGNDSPEKAAAEKKVENLFVALLVKFAQQGRYVNPTAGVNFAPAVFAKEKEAKAAKVGKAALADAMRRLFDANRIRVDEDNRGGHPRRNIVVV